MVEQRVESLTVSLLEEAMPIPHRPSAVTLGSIARHAIAAMVTTFALCTPALSQTAPPDWSRSPWRLLRSRARRGRGLPGDTLHVPVPTGVVPGMFVGAAITAL